MAEGVPSAGPLPERRSISIEAEPRVMPHEAELPAAPLGARGGAGFPFAFWRFGSSERRKHERDSLRSRSKEGRPGSRKHRRYTHSVDLVNSLRRVMVSRGEENLPSDVDEVEEERPQARPSVFYRLLESEGANALDAWAAAEARRGRSPRVRAKDAAPRMAEERTRQVRRTFRENWQYLSQSQSSQELIAKLEQLAQDAFGTPESQLQDMLWQLLWTGEELATKAGAPPASEMQLEGLDPSERKVVHQLARLIGLHSESRSVEEETSAKVLTLRPRGCQASSWSAPFSVAQVLSAEVVTA